MLLNIIKLITTSIINHAERIIVVIIIFKISIHAHIRLYVDTEVDILGETTNVLGQLSRRCVQQSGEVTVGRVDPLIKCISAIHYFWDVIHVIYTKNIEY